MSTLNCPVFRVEKFAKNPNSDNLCVINGPQGPLQFLEGDFKVGDLACFVPADSIVDTKRPEFAWLADRADSSGSYRVRGIRLRKIPSVGLILRAPDIVNGLRVQVGDNLAPYFQVNKYEPPVATYLHSDESPAPVQVPIYDIENTWNLAGASVDVFDNEDYKETIPLEKYHSYWLITEKIHGCNFKCFKNEDGVHVGSRSRWTKPGNVWWDAYNKQAVKLNDIMDATGWVLFGEVFGKVQDITYGVNGVSLKLFDAYDPVRCRFVSPRDLYDVLLRLKATDLYVPVLNQFIGTYEDALKKAEEFRSGKSTICDAFIREGVVLRPAQEEVLTVGKYAGRLITKLVSPEYLSRNGGTENH